MFSNKSVFVPAVVVFASLLVMASARGQDSQCYTVASVQGTWALIATYGANVAISFGERSVDGDGNFTGVFVVNGPTAGSTTGERTITTGTQVGSFTVNCDGSGTITRTLTASNGVIATQTDDFIITGSTVTDGKLIATAIADAVRVPSALVAGGIFVTRVHTRLPDRTAAAQPQKNAPRNR